MKREGSFRIKAAMKLLLGMMDNYDECGDEHYALLAGIAGLCKLLESSEDGLFRFTIEEGENGEWEEAESAHWIETYGSFICSACKWEYSAELPYMSNHGIDSMQEAFRFCPHCGSEMFDEEDGDEP